MKKAEDYKDNTKNGKLKAARQRDRTSNERGIVLFRVPHRMKGKATLEPFLDGILLAEPNARANVAEYDPLPVRLIDSKIPTERKGEEGGE